MTNEERFEEWFEHTFLSCGDPDADEEHKCWARIGFLAACPQWQPIETAPKDGTYVLLAGPSGYRGTPLRVRVCRYDAEYRPRQPWVDYAGDSFLDSGDPPTHWMPLPALPKEEK